MTLHEQNKARHEAMRTLAGMLLDIDGLPVGLRLSSKLMQIDLSGRFNELVGGVLSMLTIEDGTEPPEQDVETANKVVEYMELVAAGLDSFLESHPDVAKIVSSPR